MLFPSKGPTEETEVIDSGDVINEVKLEASWKKSTYSHLCLSFCFWQAVSN